MSWKNFHQGVPIPDGLTLPRIVVSAETLCLKLGSDDAPVLERMDSAIIDAETLLNLASKGTREQITAHLRWRVAMLKDERRMLALESKPVTSPLFRFAADLTRAHADFYRSPSPVEFKKAE